MLSINNIYECHRTITLYGYKERQKETETQKERRNSRK